MMVMISKHLNSGGCGGQNVNTVVQFSFKALY